MEARCSGDIELSWVAAVVGHCGTDGRVSCEDEHTLQSPSSWLSHQLPCSHHWAILRGRIGFPPNRKGLAPLRTTSWPTHCPS